MTLYDIMLYHIGGRVRVGRREKKSSVWADVLPFFPETCSPENAWTYIFQGFSVAFKASLENKVLQNMVRHRHGMSPEGGMGSAQGDPKRTGLLRSDINMLVEMAVGLVYGR